MNGQKQREALSAAERALTLLEKGRTADARAAARQAAAVDQIGAYATLPDALEAVAARRDQGGDVPAAAWDRLAAAVGAGPLAAVVERLRTRRG